MQYLGSIGLKVNYKLGSVSSSIEKPLFQPFKVYNSRRKLESFITRRTKKDAAAF